MKPVRTPGSPSLDRLSSKMVFSLQYGLTSLKMMLGNGVP